MDKTAETQVTEWILKCLLPSGRIFLIQMFLWKKSKGEEILQVFLLEEKFTAKRIISIFVLLISLYYFYDYVESFEVYRGSNYVVGTQTYSNNTYFSFEFPENWSYQEFGTFVSLYDENHDFAASISYVRRYGVPVGSDKESYEKHFKIHGFDDFEIIELSHLKIDDYNADKIILQDKIGWQEYLYLSYNIDTRLSLEGQHPKTKAKDLFPQLEKIFNSIRFTVD